MAEKFVNENNTKTLLTETKDYIDRGLNNKQDTLTAGTNITIDANNVISASGGLQEVTASDVDSESATSGQVLTADGTGGASWQNASAGKKLYRHDIIFNNLDHVLIINDSSTSFNYTRLAQYLYNNNHRGGSYSYPVISALRGYKSSNKITLANGIWSAEGSSIKQRSYDVALQPTIDFDAKTFDISFSNSTSSDVTLSSSIISTDRVSEI